MPAPPVAVASESENESESEDESEYESESGDESEYESESGDESEEENVGTSTYANTETRDGWNLVDDGKRKRKNSCPIPPLRAAPTRKDIYVQGLAVSMFKYRDDLEDSIRAHCKEKGVVNVYYISVFYQFDLKTANCKITIAEEDLEAVLEPDFWPENVSVREWYDY